MPADPASAFFDVILYIEDVDLNDIRHRDNPHVSVILYIEDVDLNSISHISTISGRMSSSTLRMWV